MSWNETILAKSWTHVLSKYGFQQALAIRLCVPTLIETAFSFLQHVLHCLYQLVEFLYSQNKARNGTNSRIPVLFNRFQFFCVYVDSRSFFTPAWLLEFRALESWKHLYWKRSLVYIEVEFMGIRKTKPVNQTLHMLHRNMFIRGPFQLLVKLSLVRISFGCRFFDLLLSAWSMSLWVSPTDENTGSTFSSEPHVAKASRMPTNSFWLSLMQRFNCQ